MVSPDRSRQSRAQVIDAAKEKADDRRRRGELLLPDSIEQVLDEMREANDGVDADRCRSTLDGVSRTKDGVDRLGVVGRRLELQKAFLHLREVLVGLRPERFDERLEIESLVVHQPTLRTSTLPSSV